MSKKILILGGDGMAGHILRAYLEEKGHDVCTTTRGAEAGKNSFFDVLADYRELEKIIERIQPDFVVNCIGVLVKYSEEHKPETVLINSFLPHYADSLSEKHKFKLIHISTDCVFSGKKGNYAEDDFPDADTFYGRSKFLGEIKNDKNLTFRTSIVGPEIKKDGTGLFDWFVKQEGEVKGFTKAIWTGVTTLELAKAIEKSFDVNVTGLYHLVNNEKINKHDLLRLFKKYTGKEISIGENNEYASDKSLVNTRKDFDFKIPSYEEMIKEMCEWIRSCPVLYKNYKMELVDR